MMNTMLAKENGWRYSFPAPHKTGAGIATPKSNVAHNRAKAVFLCAKHSLIRIMAGRAGQLSGWPGSTLTGCCNPVRLATNEIATSRGGLIKPNVEAAIMATIPALSHPQVTVENGFAVTTSQAIADFFGKLHKNIIQKIESLECSPEFASANFSAHAQNITIGNNAERESKIYYITKNGFTFLVMGFTGKKAAAFKEAYIAEFDRMEAQLRNPVSIPAASVFPVGREFTYITEVNADGLPVSMRVLRDDEFTCSLATHTEMLQRMGTVVISWQKMSQLTAEQITRLWMDAKKQYLANSPF